METEKSPDCPHRKLRADLPALTDRLKALPIDERGYPVPFFVQWVKGPKDKPEYAEPGEGIPEFRIASQVSLLACIRDHVCWVCGQKLGVHRAYVVGPMCIINRTSAEPPSHVECAEWSVRGCPFLTRPNMVRREDEVTDAAVDNVAGIMIKRNPGVTIIWHVRNVLHMWRDPNGRILFDIGDPESVRWFKEGRKATNEECIEAIDTGLQSLLDLAENAEERNEIMEKRDRLVATLKGTSKSTVILPEGS
jgi:hypothetical protein